MPPAGSEGHGGFRRYHDDTLRGAAEIATALRGIRAEAAKLDPAPSGATDQRPATLARERTPARIDVLVHLDHRTSYGWSENPDDRKAAGNTLPIRPTLIRWELTIRRGRNMPRRGAPPGDLTEFLLTHTEWAARQPWAGEMRDELRKLWTQLQHANGTAPDPPIGRCYLPTEEGNCGGPIHIDERHGAARCGRCHATWDGPQLAMLAYELKGNRW